MILDSKHRVIASSDANAQPGEAFRLNTQGQNSGSWQPENGRQVAFALTPGYESYQGLGWYGVIEQREAQSPKR